MFTKDIGIDLGTANTLVYMKGRGIIMREPSVVAVDPRSDELRVRSVGHEAKAVIGRAPGSIVAVRPLKDGVIADFDITAAMLQSFIRPCALFIALVGLYIGVRLLPFDFIHTDAWRTAQNHAVRIAFIVLLAWGLLGSSKCVELALVGTRSRFDLGAGDTVIRFLERIYKAVILLFAGVLVVTEMG